MRLCFSAARYSCSYWSGLKKSLIAADGGLRDDFKDAAGGDFHKARIVSFGGSRAALGQVRRDGYCCSAHLVGQAESLLCRKGTCQLIYEVGEGNRLVPSFKLLEVKHSGDCLSPSTLNLQPSTGLPQFRDARPAPAWVGYSDHPGIARAQRRLHHHDLYPCSPPGRQRHKESPGLPVRGASRAGGGGAGCRVGPRERGTLTHAVSGRAQALVVTLLQQPRQVPPGYPSASGLPPKPMASSSSPAVPALAQTSPSVCSNRSRSWSSAKIASRRLRLAVVRRRQVARFITLVPP